MGKLMKNIYEHLITKKKYNTLELKYEIVREDLERKQIELSAERKIHREEKEIWEKKLKRQEREIANLKKETANKKGKSRGKK